jgi:hypothetical protein
MATDSTLPVTIRFFGICTHFEADSMPQKLQPLDWYHRVVLVNASEPADYRRVSPHLDDVPPHKARLQIRKDDLASPVPPTLWFPVTYEDDAIIEWALEGVSLKMANAEPAPEPKGRASCIPSLTAHILPAPNPPGPRAYDRNSAGTACFFDFDPIVVQAELLNGGAVIAAIDVSSSDAPAILVTSFGGETLTIPVRPGAEISVSNIPDDKDVDKEEDFILHYLVLAEFPSDPWYPTEPFTCAEPMPPIKNRPRNLPVLTTPGCSDSYGG